ncbi:MAG: hypothetical protein IH595_12960 [Bacteroidales bacterium]|nr:hypothetical protein [Bacteroidales bacterium]
MGKEKETKRINPSGCWQKTFVFTVIWDLKLFQVQNLSYQEGIIPLIVKN